MSNIKNIFERVEKELEHIFASETSGHDFYHAKRVLNLSLHLQKKEGGDILVVALSAYLHDLHRVIQNDTKKYCSPKDSLSKIKSILEKLDIDEETINKVLYCVEVHEEYDFTREGKTAKSKEALIIQDADNLDAMGAIGIARVFAFGGAHNVPLWKPEIPFLKGTWNEEDGPSPSQIHHFYEKLLRLKNNMNTNEAKKMAKGRHKILLNFLEEFFKEWDGKK